MKKAVIICVLSLALCLSQAAPPPEHPAETAPAVNDKKEDNSTVKTEIKIITTQSPNPTPNKPATPAPETKGDAKPAETKAADIKPADSKPAEPNPQETKPIDNKPEDNKTDKKNESAPKPSDKPESPKTPEKAANETKPADGKAETPAPQAVTVKPSEGAKDVTVKPSEAPKDVTEKPILAARGFDGPSFIGGMILTLGLLAIGFMGFKYYKNQTERNYHTL